MSETPGFPARRAAMRLLDAVLRRGDTLDQAMGSATKELDNFADRALARAIAAEVLRYLVDIDALIDSATRKPLPEDAKARTVLRIMLAQWLRLATPPHAIVATGLPLLQGGPRRLAHGVFSALVRRAVVLPRSPTLPEKVEARWGAEATNIASGLAVPPQVDLTLRNPDETQKWAERLDAISLAPGHLRLRRGVAIAELPGYAEGAWWVQDLAASLPARLLGQGMGRKALDLCAAPGGKALQLAAAGWDVTALDISAKRLERLSDNAKRTGLTCTTVVANALEWKPEISFDAILLDAPCTATGTCRRHPDVLHRIGERQIAEMAELQAKLIKRAASWLKPQGLFVYAVCSLEEEEGKAQIFPTSLSPDPIGPEECPAVLISACSDNRITTHPGMRTEEGGVDGFFISRYHRAA
ncbi:methyltransferase domain-containing protein [Altericroceibacterium spongiae]|uniref:Methyltransferase domain-containing protein n=1 Tax=Altericroceibacterium spongiae TaxID=2320269 RepID=A0A420EQ50_9SPHN|nr:RsmB/NOP family class I SAM-dependent RNA methyltransferase [Altericroceibacterium spongiae]RKF22797.1 methyltransferase domain-containing protein [Altericroceibacterium spongiae]